MRSPRAKLLTTPLLLLLGVSACTQLSTPAARYTEGQLLCAVATATGPLVVPLISKAGVPVIVTGLASALVASYCTQAGGVPVAPPASPTAVSPAPRAVDTTKVSS